MKLPYFGDGNVSERFFWHRNKTDAQSLALSHKQITKRSYPAAILRPAAAVSAARVPNCRSYKDTAGYLLQGLQSKVLQFFGIFSVYRLAQGKSVPN